jgi:hypothetical protein
MNKKIFIYLTFIGLIGLLFSCEKDETKAVLTDSPIAPTLLVVPDLTLGRTIGTDSLTFVGTTIDPGFQASVMYYLEACATGTNFQEPITIFNGDQPLSMKITVSDLNGLMLSKFAADQVYSMDIRLRAALPLSSGTGKYEYNSVVQTKNVTVYGLPRLDITGTGSIQKVQSPLGDGKYAGLVKLDPTKPFKLKDPDTNVEYGGTAGVLSANGAGIVGEIDGWHQVEADIQALTYKVSKYQIGLVGSATPNSWDGPDQLMEYDPGIASWRITLNLIDGMIKFRLNNDWAWNLGGTTDNLTQNGADIPVIAGNYTLTLTIINGTTGTYKIVKN